MDNSPLGRLSAELRNRIYQYTLKIEPVCGRPWDRDVYLYPGNRDILYPITRVCRQLRRETLAMYLSTTSFDTIYLDSDGHLVRWLKALGPVSCSNIKCLRLSSTISSWGLGDAEISRLMKSEHVCLCRRTRAWIIKAVDDPDSEYYRFGELTSLFTAQDLGKFFNDEDGSLARGSSWLTLRWAFGFRSWSSQTRLTTSCH